MTLCECQGTIRAQLIFVINRRPHDVDIFFRYKGALAPILIFITMAMGISLLFSVNPERSKTENICSMHALEDH